MQQLLYRSRAIDGLPAEEIFRIIETSARENPARDLTGFLIYARDMFVQFLEGPADSIDLLLNELRADRRHCNLEILYRADAASRRFPAWRMQRIDFQPGKFDQSLTDLRRRGAPERALRMIEDTLAWPRQAA